jgi:hypothetical protein
MRTARREWSDSPGRSTGAGASCAYQSTSRPHDRRVADVVLIIGAIVLALAVDLAVVAEWIRRQWR